MKKNLLISVLTLLAINMNVPLQSVVVIDNTNQTVPVKKQTTQISSSSQNSGVLVTPSAPATPSAPPTPSAPATPSAPPVSGKPSSSIPASHPLPATHVAPASTVKPPPEVPPPAPKTQTLPEKPI